MWGQIVPISAPVLWPFCCSLEVACLHEETVWSIASIIFSLGSWWWVISERVRAQVRTTRLPDGTTTTHLFFCLHTHIHTHYNPQCCPSRCFPSVAPCPKNRTVSNVRTVFHGSMNSCLASAFAGLELEVLPPHSAQPLCVCAPTCFSADAWWTPMYTC